jgi:hypothetical protein
MKYISAYETVALDAIRALSRIKREDADAFGTVDGGSVRFVLGGQHAGGTDGDGGAQWHFGLG